MATAGSGRICASCAYRRACPSGGVLCIRPHALAITADTTATDASRVWFAGDVVDTEFLGEFSRYEVRVGSARLTIDAPHLSAAPIHAPGSRVQVGIDPAEVRVLS